MCGRSLSCPSQKIHFIVYSRFKLHVRLNKFHYSSYNIILGIFPATHSTRALMYGTWKLQQIIFFNFILKSEEKKLKSNLFSWVLRRNNKIYSKIYKHTTGNLKVKFALTCSHIKAIKWEFILSYVMNIVVFFLR